LWARSLHEPEAAQERLRRDRVWRSLFAEVIGAGRAAGEFAPAVDPELAALSITSFMDGLSVQMTLRDPALTPELMDVLLVDHAERTAGASLRPDLDAKPVSA